MSTETFFVTSNETENSTNPETDDLGALVYHYGGFALITCVNIPGNLLIISTFLRHETLRKPANIFIVGLASSDLCLGVVYPMYTAAHVHHPDFQRVLGNWPVCVGIITALETLLFCSSYHLLATTVTRYVAIVKPLHYRVYLTKKVATVSVLGIWTGSFITSFLIYYQQKPENYDNECIYEKLYGLKRITLLFTIAMLIPLTIMFGLYFRIARIARKHVKGRANDKTCNVRNSGKEWKATIMVACLLAVFTSVWLPVFIYFYINYFCNRCIDSPYVRATTRIMVYMNTAVNVFIYSLRLDVFRNAVRKDLKRCCCICFRQSSEEGIEASISAVSTETITRNSTPVCAHTDRFTQM